MKVRHYRGCLIRQVGISWYLVSPPRSRWSYDQVFGSLLAVRNFIVMRERQWKAEHCAVHTDCLACAEMGRACKEAA